MKIKHFAGYGTVDAVKVSRKVKDGLVTLVVKVSGDHEWGLYRPYDDVVDWLVKRFDKKWYESKRPGYERHVNFTGQCGISGGVEYCIYTFQYFE